MGWGGWEKWTGGAGRGWSTVLERLVSVLRSRALGKQLSFECGGDQARFTLTELDVDLNPTAVTMGQLGEVVVEACELSWRGTRCERAVAQLHNCHVQSGGGLQLVAAPVDLCFTVGVSELNELLAAYRPELVLEISESDVARVRWRRHPAWGFVEVDAGADGTRIWARPVRLVRGSRSLGVVRRLPPVSFRLGLPAERVTVVSIAISAGAVELHAQLDELRIPLDSAAPAGMRGRWGSLGTLLDSTAWWRER